MGCFTESSHHGLQWNDLFPEVREAIAHRLDLVDLLPIASASKELCTVSRARLDGAKKRISLGHSKSSWDAAFISALGLVISRFLSKLDIITGRSDIEFPLVTIDSKGGLSLSALPPANGAFGSISPVGQDSLNMQKLSLEVYGAGKPVALVTVGRAPAKVAILVAGECSWQQAALSVTVLASSGGHRAVQHEVQGCALAQNPLQDDLLAGSLLLSNQFEVVSILVFHRVGATRKFVRQRFTRTGQA